MAVAVVNNSSLINFVIDECRKLPPDRAFKIKGNGVVCRCPFHAGGNERTPSLGINLHSNRAPIGYFHCLGCHQKGPWNVFADLYGLRRLSTGQVREAKATLELAFDNEDPLPPDYTQFKKWPDTVKWRTISGSTLLRYEGRSIQFGRIAMLYLPVIINGENRGGINCRLNKSPNKEDSSYINTTGDWSLRALFGYDVAARKKGPLWVVEGPRDTLKTDENGGRVVGLIGSAVSKDKLSLILNLDPPSVLVATDPDEAGDTASAALFAGLEKYLPVKRYKFEPDTDPAVLTAEKVARANQRMIQMYGK